MADNAKFCQVCGTPVASPAPINQRPALHQTVRKTSFPIAVIVLIAILILAVVVAVVVILPIQPVNFNQQNEAVAGNINSVKLILDAGIADVNLILRDLPGNRRVAVNISATGWRGLFGPDQPLQLAFDENTNNQILTYQINVTRSEGWQIFNPIDVFCDVFVDPSSDLDLAVTTTTGTISMYIDVNATIQSLSFAATTGSVLARVNEGVIISGNFSLEATTGNVQLLWNDAETSGKIPVNLETSTGLLDININQTRQFAGNVSLNAESTTGTINFAIDVQNDVGVKISPSTTFGGIDIEQNGFSGNEAPLQSDNYPAGSNFDVTLGATTGSINIAAKYQLGGTRS